MDPFTVVIIPDFKTGLLHFKSLADAEGNGAKKIF